ncbi:MAG: DUF4349 domain-containing protein [Clostridia bacterium]|nr:DUF4349 domain-containing protein [Clostridia bacterium]
MIKRIFAMLIMGTLLLGIAVGCGVSKSSQSIKEGRSNQAVVQETITAAGADQFGDKAAYSSSVKGEALNSEEGKAADNGTVNLDNNPVNSGHKIIRTGEIQLETLNFEESVSKLTDYIASIGGYIETSSVQGKRIASGESRALRSAHFTFRIPQMKYNQMFVDVEKFGTVVSKQSRGEDITDRYFDTEARLKALKIQEERLLSLLQKAEKMEDILAIERELQNTRYQIENYTGTIRKWDSLVNFSTITVNVYEVREIKPDAPDKRDSLFNRISFGFINSMRQLWRLTQDIIVGLVVALPFIVPLAGIGYLISLISRARKNRKKTVAVKPEASSAENKKDE